MSCWICFLIHTNIFRFSMLSQHSSGTSHWNSPLQRTRTYESCTVSTMAADDLLMPGARPPAAMVLTLFSGNIPVLATVGLLFSMGQNIQSKTRSIPFLLMPWLLDTSLTHWVHSRHDIGYYFFYVFCVITIIPTSFVFQYKWLILHENQNYVTTQGYSI